MGGVSECAEGRCMQKRCASLTLVIQMLGLVSFCDATLHFPNSPLTTLTFHHCRPPRSPICS